jgi:hypothetical protein
MPALIGHEIATDRPDFAKFPVNFPVSREFGAETGSQLTASSATQSGLCGAFIPFTGFASSAVRFNGRARPAERGPRLMFCPASRWVKLVRVFTPVSLYNQAT